MKNYLMKIVGVAQASCLWQYPRKLMQAVYNCLSAFDHRPQARCLCYFMGLLALLTNVHAIITVSVIDNMNGTFTYDYTVDNTSGAFDIFSWTLEFPEFPDWNQDDEFLGGDVSLPSIDWFASATPFPVMGVAGQDFTSFGDDVLQGETRSGFSFTSSLTPNLITYYEFDPFGLSSATGLVLGPGVIPEPLTIWTGVIVGIAILGLRKRNRKKN